MRTRRLRCCVNFLIIGIIWSQLFGLTQHMPLIMTLLWELCCLRRLEKKNRKEISTTEAMVVRGRSTERGENQRGTSRSNSKGKKSKQKCWFCGKSRHLKKDCWKIQNASKEDSTKESKEANVAETSSSMVDEVLYTCDVSHQNQHWFLYFGASSHMCLHRNWFSTYQSIDDGVVFMGNDFSCKIVGVGRVWMKMHDGSIRALTDVRHVPEIINNLISLGVLDYVGYKCTTQGGVLNVSKGILVVMKENRIENLYHIEGRIEINQSVVTYEDASDYVYLWHHRLGHMNDKGLKLLVDRKSLPCLKFLNLIFCKYCVFGKHYRRKFKVGRHI
jgi:hypothetical protein